MTKLQEIQEILGVVPDNIWGPRSQTALDLLLRPPDKASSFADEADLKAFKACKAKGKTDEECFAVGDNGIGYDGMNTATDQVCIAALPRDVLERKWGSLKNAARRRIEVTFPAVGGKKVVGLIGDYMSPDLASGATIDLNPGFAKAFGLIPPFIAAVRWQWVA